MLISSMEDPHREIVIRVRMNQAEIDALAKIAAMKGLGVSATIREYIHQNAPK